MSARWKSMDWVQWLILIVLCLSALALAMAWIER